jgi:anti-sigma factor RsiW
MPCEHYKDALVEAAATGAEPKGELRAHLAACASCRAAFANEQSLFVSIDAGLHASANADVPPSLLPRVRAALEEISVPERTWLSNSFVLATAATAALALSFTLAIRHTGSGNVEPIVVTKNPPAPLVQAPNLALPSNSNSAQPPRTISPSNRATSPLRVGRSVVPEVLVPRDQEVLLARYSEQWRSRKAKTVLAEVSSETTLEPLRLAPIQIDQLDVKLLAEGQSQ